MNRHYSIVDLLPSGIKSLEEEALSPHGSLYFTSLHDNHESSPFAIRLATLFLPLDYKREGERNSLSRCATLSKHGKAKENRGGCVVVLNATALVHAHACSIYSSQVRDSSRRVFGSRGSSPFPSYRQHIDPCFVASVACSPDILSCPPFSPSSFSGYLKVGSFQPVAFVTLY